MLIKANEDEYFESTQVAYVRLRQRYSENDPHLSNVVLVNNQVIKVDLPIDTVARLVDDANGFDVSNVVQKAFDKALAAKKVK